MNAQRAIAKMIAADPSPFPASFDGSTIRFQLALFAMLSLTIVGGMIAGWMSRELWRGRHEAFPWEPLFAIRVIFFLCGVGAFIRCGPEAAYMISYREGSLELLTQLMFVKRWLDAASIIPGLGWMATAWIFYTPICSQMVLVSRTAPQSPKVSRQKVMRLSQAMVLTFVIAALIAIGKR